MKNTQNKKRKGFTIVELVIVIAVIAVLAAVMIPTFGGIIERADVSADEQVAAALTTELKTYLMTETIDSEEELMLALTESGIDEKLVPTAMKHGYYFWFHMESQRFVVAKAKDIEEKPKQSRAPVTDDDSITYVNVYSFRDVYETGYYFVSRTNPDGDGLSEAIGFIDELGDANDYDKLIKYFEQAMENDVDTSVLEVVFNKVKDTTIRTNYGGFFYGGDSKYEYISPKATRLVGTYYNYANGEVESKGKAPTPSFGDYIDIPSNIKQILSGGLLYESAGMNVLMPSFDAIVSMFCRSSSNDDLTIKATDTGTEYYVKTTYIYTKADGKKVKVNGKNVTLNYPSLEFEDYYIGYDADGVHSYDAVNDIIYVSYGNGSLQFNAVNKANSDEVSYTVNKWTITNADGYTLLSDPSAYASTKKAIIKGATGLLPLSDLHFANGKTYCELIVQAEAYMPDGTIEKDTVKVVVIKSVNATLTFGDTEPLVLGGGSVTGPQLGFTGSSASYGLSVTANYSTDANGNNPLINKLTNNFEIDTSNGKLIGLVYSGGNVSFKTKADGTLDCGTDANGNLYYSFDISVSGSLKTTITGNIVDTSNADVRFNYKKHNQAGSASYKLGTEGTIKISDLFSLSAGAKNKDGSATITIYGAAPTNGIFDATTEIGKMITESNADAEANGYAKPYTLGINYPKSISYSAWSSDANHIEFEGSISGNSANYANIYIEIVPNDGSISTVAKVDIIDGAVNVTDLNSLKDANNKIIFNQNVVLHGDCKITTGTTIDIGAKTLYGNGYVINAEEYVAESAGIATMNVIHYTDYTKVYCNDLNCPHYEKEWVDGVCYDTKGNALYSFEIPKNDHAHIIWKNGKFDTISVWGEREGEKIYKSNQAMILLSGGTIDNIYIDGPVYPTLQYKDNDKYIPEGSTDEYSVKTPYFVTGIKTTGDATITDSYVSGFRQPVMVTSAPAEGHFVTENNTSSTVIDKSAETTTIRNTVLRGGNYANLDVVSGNVVLEDVTTIQDYSGMTPTVGDNADAIYGAGILLEESTTPSDEVIAEAMGLTFAGSEEARIIALLQPLSTKIEIKGDLIQHNWLAKDTSNKALPTVELYNNLSIGMKEIFGYFFSGFGLPNTELNVGRMGRFMYFIHQDIPVAENAANRITDTYYDVGAKDPTADKNELLNLGIMFVDVEQSYNDSVVNEDYAKVMIKIDESGRNGGSQFGRVSVQLSHEEMKGITGADLRTNRADVTLVCWSYADGRQWKQSSVNRDLPFVGNVPYFSYQIVEGSTDWNNVKIVTDSDKYYSPDALYGSNGAYSAWYGNNN